MNRRDPAKAVAVLRLLDGDRAILRLAAMILEELIPAIRALRQMSQKGVRSAGLSVILLADQG